MNRSMAGFLCAGLFVLPAGAASLIEVIDDEGTMSRVYVDGSRLRAQAEGEVEYVLFDAAAGRLLMVNSRDRTFIDMSESLADQRRQAEAAPQLQFKRLGPGPRIAGFATERYAVTARNQDCGEEFLSREALSRLGSIAAMAQMNSLLGGDDGDMGESIGDSCAEATAAFSPRYEDLGIPLRAVDANGMLVYEISRLQDTAELPPGGFEPPGGYTRVSLQQMMQLGSEQAWEDQSMMPSAEELEQMMPSEDDLRQMQEALERLQRQHQERIQGRQQ